ncbi:MAG: hypothetical protein V4727_13050 [Verrucomicrobiota bacterium]
MTIRPEIEELARKIAKRHNGFLLRRHFIVAILVTSFVVILASLFYVTRGYAVPIIIPSILIGIGIISTIAYYLTKRMDNHAAVIEADHFFDLKDGITTARHLAVHAPDEPTTILQWNWLSPKLPNCDPATITQPFPKKLGAIASALTLAAIVLCILPPSDSVKAEQELAETTRQRVAESKEELEKLIEELEKDIVGEDEDENIDMDEFRKMVKAIDQTGDRAEAARQFARIERKVRDATRGLDQQRDEETIKLAAKELQKSDDTEARKIGKKLDEKELKEAAELLEKLAAKKIDPKDLKNGAEKKQEKLDEAKKDLAKMRAATKRLAAAGKQRQAARQAQGGGAGENAQGGEGEGAEGEGEAQGEGKPLEDMLAELDEAAEEMEKDLEEMEFDPDAEWDEENEDNQGEMMKMKGQLGQHLKKMQGKRQAKSKMDALRDALAQAQANAQGQSQMQGPGGKEAGKGSSWSERKEKDDSQKNGALAELKGQHGEGPSLSAVEDSESGTGVSSRKGSTKERDFNRQMESFVQRNDVPESLKLGVRNYFQNLQSATKE